MIISYYCQLIVDVVYRFFLTHIWLLTFVFDDIDLRLRWWWQQMTHKEKHKTHHIACCSSSSNKWSNKNETIWRIELSLEHIHNNTHRTAARIKCTLTKSTRYDRRWRWRRRRKKLCIYYTHHSITSHLIAKPSDWYTHVMYKNLLNGNQLVLTSCLTSFHAGIWFFPNLIWMCKMFILLKFTCGN